MDLQSAVQKINFRYCCCCLVCQVGLVLASFLLWKITVIPPKPLHILQQLLLFLMNFYVYLGYVKYSFLRNEKKFRDMILAVLGLSVAQSFILISDQIFGLTKSPVCLSLPMFLATPMLFYAFNMIRNGEASFFRRLAKLNFSLAFTGILCLLLLIPAAANLILMTMALLAAFTLLALTRFWEIRLFSHLQSQHGHEKRL